MVRDAVVDGYTPWALVVEDWGMDYGCEDASNELDRQCWH